MPNLKGNYRDLRGEKGPVPHAVLMLDVTNDSNEQVSVIFARGLVYMLDPVVHKPGYDRGQLLGEAFVLERWNELSRFEANQTKDWWIWIDLSRGRIEGIESLRAGRDLHFNLFLQALMWQTRGDAPFFRWINVQDHSDSSKLYVKARIAKSDWERVLEEISPRRSFFHKLTRQVLRSWLMSKLTGLWKKALIALKDLWN